jgi:hypothetical protein
VAETGPQVDAEAQDKGGSTVKSVADPHVLNHLIHRIGLLVPATPRRWGTMTAGEMLCHLGDASTSVLGHPGGAPGPKRPIRKWIALYSAIPWPHGMKTPRSVDPRRDGTRPGEFEADRARAISGLQALAAAPPTAFPAAHRIFGHMTPRDWHYWGYRHTDHHLRQFGV